MNTTPIRPGNPAVQLPPGDYYVGDPCYGVDDYDRWDRQLGSVWGESFSIGSSTKPNRDFNGPYGTIAVDPENGAWWAGHHTQYGDGGYVGSDGHTYDVDAGLLGVVPASRAEPNALYAMQLVTFPEPFDITYDPTTGAVSIGHIEIVTGGMEDKDEDEENL